MRGRASHAFAGNGGKGLGKSTKRHRKILKDNIQGVRIVLVYAPLSLLIPIDSRLARRGGVTRIAAQIYDEIRLTLKQRLIELLKQIANLLESSGPIDTGRKTVTVQDVVFVLKRMGQPIYGFGEGER
ncbi:hypothetical protein AAFC00_001910 [Neodothiora populina]|uniref:Histone H4 n=1 Tax=Neodothiora populina TaxID=2781224 RepID=A0ABR3PQJ9_9PEZI